jgi:hypothetical protein
MVNVPGFQSKYIVNHHIVFNKYLNTTEVQRQPVDKYHKA